MSAARVCLGVIAGAHGVAGLVRVKCFTEAPEAIGAYGVLSDEAGERSFDLAVVGPGKGGVLARIKGVTDRDAAAALKGTRLYVAREALPGLQEDEFYHADLVGLTAVLQDGTALGAVAAVHDFGAGAVLEITRDQGMPLMLAFTRETVPVLDIGAGRLVVAPPPELLED